jgi:CheY-like chemotaxis protein
MELKGVLASGGDVRLEVGYVQPNLVTTVHPTALRQTLIAAVGRLAQHMASGKITTYARLKDGNVRITVSGSITRGDTLTERDLIGDILVPDGASVEASVDGAHVFLWITVPSLGQTTVLIVDDNPDMLHFYQRATTGTRYHIVHAPTGQQAMTDINTSPPDIIVLDVMLPDVDGWKLLMQLHENPITRSIPVIVCSVVREEKLALTLGAVLYLPKPVDPRRFVAALDEVYHRTSTETPRVPVNN